MRCYKNEFTTTYRFASVLIQELKANVNNIKISNRNDLSIDRVPLIGLF